MRRNSLLVAIALLSCACSTSKHLPEPAPVINEITIVAPYSRVDILGQDGHFHYSDSLSALSELLIGTTLESAGLPFTKVITVVGRSNQEVLDGDYESLAGINPKKLESTRLPPALHAFLSTYSSRYALLVYSEGFVWEELPVFVDEELIRYESKIYLVVADTRTGRIVHFKRSCPEQADPISARFVPRRVNSLLEGLNVAR